MFGIKQYVYKVANFVECRTLTHHPRTQASRTVLPLLYIAVKVENPCSELKTTKQQEEKYTHYSINQETYTHRGYLVVQQVIGNFFYIY